MFSSISWSAYLAFIAVSAFIYYVFVFYTYYRHDLFKTLQIKPVSSASIRVLQKTNDPSDYQSKVEDVSIQSFFDEVQAFAQQAGQQQISKERLLQSLRGIAAKYSSLPPSDARDQVELFVIKEIETNCAMFLKVEEIRSIWNRT